VSLRKGRSVISVRRRVAFTAGESGQNLIDRVSFCLGVARPARRSRLVIDIRNYLGEVRTRDALAQPTAHGRA
jgi:hypothetical protein